MAKDNLFLGMGRGKVGDIVLSRVGGQQVARARNRAPKNPKSPLQLAQRVIMKSVALAYSLVQDITNHSFQGVAEGTPCQSVFSKRNIEMLRAVVAEEINSGERADIITSEKTNFAASGDSLAPINAYIVSEGKLATIPLLYGQPDGAASYQFYLPVVRNDESLTYAQLCAALGLNQGDQLTFMFFSYDDFMGTYQFNGFHYARIILEPSTGDMSAPFLLNGAVNLPNVKNEGDITLSLITSVTPGAEGPITTISGIGLASPHFTYETQERNTLVGAAVIASRLVGGIWARSTQSIVLRPASGAGAVENDYNTGYFGDAVSSFESAANSSLYLNQSE